MTKFILTFFIPFLVYKLSAQTVNNPIVSKSEIKDFFTDARRIININKGENYFNLCDKPLIEKHLNKKIFNEFIKSYKLDSFFTKSDFSFIMKQINQARLVVWDSSFTDSTTFLKASHIDSILNSPKLDSNRRGYQYLYNLPIFYRLTVPYFNKSKTICFISVYYWCGDLCGQTFDLIFKREDDHWKPYRIINGAVS